VDVNFFTVTNLPHCSSNVAIRHNDATRRCDGDVTLRRDFALSRHNRQRCYLEAGKYQELKYRLSSSELRMELYLDLLFDFCWPGDRFLGVYLGLKCLVATKVR
jgi:hypothetical protein